MQAAAAKEVESLLLWAPIVNGRSYVREMKALSLTATIKAPPLSEAPNDIEAAGFVVTKQTADDLSKLDLLKVQPRCQRALVMARADFPLDRRLLDHLVGLGIRAEQTAQPGFAEMMAEPHSTQVPRQAIAFAVDWLLAGTAAETASWHETTGHLATEWLDAPSLIRERVFLICQEPDLFGVLTEPNDNVTADLPIILLVNAGSAYRIGPNRLHVLLARQLASQGFRCLRLDLHGLGDSVASGREGENGPYVASAFRDIEKAMQDMETQLGVKRVVLMGLCSGAYFAFQSAAQISNSVLVESVLINPSIFFWKDGMTLESTGIKEHQVFHYYWNAAMQPSNWLKFLRGKTKIGFGEAVAILAKRWRLWNRPVDDGGMNPAGDPAGVVSHPLREDVAADLGRLEQRGRQIACFFSKSDPGYSILNFHAKKKVQAMVAAGNMTVAFIDDADHTFSFRAPRRELVYAICEHLCQRYRE